MSRGQLLIGFSEGDFFIQNYLSMTLDQHIDQAISHLSWVQRQKVLFGLNKLQHIDFLIDTPFNRKKTAAKLFALEEDAIYQLDQALCLYKAVHYQPQALP